MIHSYEDHDVTGAIQQAAEITGIAADDTPKDSIREALLTDAREHLYAATRSAQAACTAAEMDATMEGDPMEYAETQLASLAVVMRVWAERSDVLTEKRRLECVAAAVEALSDLVATMPV